MNKKILHVVNIYFVIPYFLGDQLKYMSRKGHKEYIVCSPSDELKGYSQSHSFEYKEVPINRKISLTDDLKAINAIVAYIRKHNIDIIVGHTPKGALLAMIAGKVAQVKKRIYFRHGLVFETSTGLKRKILIFIDRVASSLSTNIINVSESVAKRSLEEKLNPEWKQQILCNGTCNGIDIQKFNLKALENQKLNTLRESLKIDSGTFVIGFSGRLVRDKGIVELVEAFYKIKQSNKKVVLLLVGMLEERDALPKNTTHLIKTDESIIHVGYVNYHDIQYYYGLMDVFVLPSYREGFPTSVLEASSMQLPVITTRVTGCIDSIKNNETGLFVMHNSDEIAQAINFFIQNQKEKNTFGSNGRKFVEENFQSKLVWEEIEKIYLK